MIIRSSPKAYLRDKQKIRYGWGWSDLGENVPQFVFIIGDSDSIIKPIENWLSFCVGSLVETTSNAFTSRNFGIEALAI